MSEQTVHAWPAGWRILLSGLYLLLCLSRAMEVGAQEQAIVFDSTETPPIWSATLPGGGLGGELLRLLSDKAGIRYAINYLPPARFVRGTSPFIVGNPNLLMTEGNRAIFPIGLMHLKYFYYRPKHEPIPIKAPSDLSGHTMGVLRGTVEGRAAFESLKIKVEETDSVITLLRMLKKGRIDVAILAELPALHEIQREFPNEQHDFAHQRIPGASQPIAVMVDLDAPGGRDIAYRYRQALVQFHRSPQYLNTLRKYDDHGDVMTDSGLLERLFLLYESTWDE